MRADLLQLLICNKRLPDNVHRLSYHELATSLDAQLYFVVDSTKPRQALSARQARDKLHRNIPAPRVLMSELQSSLAWPSCPQMVWDGI